MATSPHALCFGKMPRMALIIASFTVTTTVQAAQDYTVSLNPLPAIVRDDGEVSAKFLGFIQWDAVGQDAAQSEPPSGTSVRRARLGLAGKTSHAWGYKWVYEFAGPKAELQDALLSYQPHARAMTVMGQHKDPVGLEWQSAAKYWTFHELPLLTALTPRRAIGISHRYLSDAWRVHAGVFGENHAQARDDNESYSATVHFAAYPFSNKDSHFHIGGSLREQHFNAGNPPIALKAKHETSVTTVPMLKTPALAEANSTQLIGLEFLWLYRHYLVQGEVATLSVDTPQSYRADSGYLQAAWMIKGHARQFNWKNHGFKRVKANDSPALEIAARAETLNLNDQERHYGRMTKYTLATNWHLSDVVKLSMNASIANTDAQASVPDERVKSLSLRAQLDF